MWRRAARSPSLVRSMFHLSTCVRRYVAAETLRPLSLCALPRSHSSSTTGGPVWGDRQSGGGDGRCEWDRGGDGSLVRGARRLRRDRRREQGRGREGGGGARGAGPVRELRCALRARGGGRGGRGREVEGEAGRVPQQRRVRGRAGVHRGAEPGGVRRDDGGEPARRRGGDQARHARDEAGRARRHRVHGQHGERDGRAGPALVQREQDGAHGLGAVHGAGAPRLRHPREHGVAGRHRHAHVPARAAGLHGRALHSGADPGAHGAQGAPAPPPPLPPGRRPRRPLPLQRPRRLHQRPQPPPRRCPDRGPACPPRLPPLVCRLLPHPQVTPLPPPPPPLKHDSTQPAYFACWARRCGRFLLNQPWNLLWFIVWSTVT